MQFKATFVLCVPLVNFNYYLFDLLRCIAALDSMDFHIQCVTLLIPNLIPRILFCHSPPIKSEQSVIHDTVLLIITINIEL